jgi:hypothetical protein
VTTEPPNTSPLRAALSRASLREALVPSRPVFANPWDSTVDMFACYVAVSVIDPFLLWLGGEITSSIFGFDARWPIGLFLAAALVGAAGFITIVGRERTRLSVDILAIATWLVLGLIVAPIIGLAPPVVVAVVLYALLMLGIFGYVLLIGQWQKAFIRTLSWPTTWTLLALLFAWSAYRLIYFQ